MNFPGNFHQGVSGALFDFDRGEGASVFGGGHDKIVLSDAHLLFSGHYERAGSDLVISDHDHRTIVHDYFRGQHRPALVSSDGAVVDPSIIDALTGHVEYAQAGTGAAGKVVGHVAKLTGSASIVRNGVTVELNNGDAVYQNDVVQTGSASTIGLVMIDGTTFNLAGNARLMLNDLTFDATSTSNTSLFTLMQGAVSFVAGQVAKTGDMKIGSPVAVLGIRGTAVILDISSTDGKVDISVVDQHDGQTHAVQIFRCILPTGIPGAACTAGDLIGTVTSDGPSLSLTPGPNQQVVAQEINKTVAQVGQEFATFQQVISTYDTYKAIAPNTPPPSDGRRGDANPQSTTKFASGSSTPPNELINDQLITTVSNSGQHGDTAVEAFTGVVGTSSVSVNPTPSVIPVQSVGLLQIPVSQTPATTVAITSPGASGGDFINQSEVSSGFIISGTAAAGAAPVDGQTVTVTVVDSSNAVRLTYTTTVVGGSWSVGVTAAQAQGLADGNYSIHATVLDATGNAETTVAQSFSVDTVPPAVAINAPGGQTEQPNLIVSGTGEAGSKVTILDNGNVVGSAVVLGNGTWSSAVTLTGGGNAITARATDAAGNTGTSNAVIYTLSTTGPTVTEALSIDTGSSASDHITSNDAVSGTGLANTVVSFTIDGTAIATTVTANANGVWSFTPTGLADGPHTIVASQTDTFGNTGSASLSFTLDTSAPAVAITSPGGATNQASQTISGTVDVADAGATVTILDGITAVGSAVVQANGTWTATGVTLSNGSNSLTARVTDAAGNIGTSSAVIYTLSTTGPSVTEALSIDTGSSASDHITSNDAVSGTGLANTVVSFTIDGTAIATTVTANANGAWSFTPTGLADGPHTIVASQTDTFGNTGSASLSFTLDTSAPVVAITSPGGATNQASQTISGTVDVADAGATVTILDGTTAVGSAVVQANGTWSATGVTLSNGSNSLTARVTDAAGNTGTSNAVIYTLSTTGPSVTEALAIDTGSSASDHITSNDAVNGTGLANAVVSFTIDGTAIATTVTANATGAWSFTPTGLADGPHTIVASQTDTFGNTGSASLSFTLDTTAPVVAITSAGGPTNQAAHTLAGTGEAGSVVTLFDNGSATALGTATVGSNGTWSAGVTLSGNGSHSIVARETDAAGNTGSSTAVVFNLSTTGPTVTEALSIDTGSSASDHITSNDAVSGTGLANTVVSFTIDGTAIATTVTANANGAWSFTPTGLADGPHTIVASQTDTFGNAGSASLSFTLDTTAPVVAITSAGGATNQAAHTLSGTGEAGSVVTLFDNGSATALGTATVGSNGTWSAGVTLSGNGSHSIVARETDAAGNTGSSTAVVFNLSTTGPTVTEALSIDTGSSASDHITSNDAVSGTGLANTVVSFTIDGSAIASAVTANANGAWSFTPTGLADGPHTIVASQTDTFGNTGSASLSFTLDTSAPAVAITSPGGATNQASQTISGTVDVADAGATVTILDGITAVGSAVVQANGTWTATGVTLSNGSNSLTARVTDAAGNIGTSSAVIYTLSTTGPSVTEALSIDTGSSASDHVTSNDAVSGTGLANTVVSFTIDGTAIATTVTANANGVWSFTPTGLADGPHTIVASQTDTFGNTGSASLSFTLDTTAPVVAITSAGGATNQAAHTLAGTGEAGSIVTLFDNGSATALGTATVGTNGTWSAGVTLSGNGSHSIVARETDAAGNTGSSTAVVFNLSTTGPTVTEALSIDTGSSASDHITSNDAVTGTGLANTVVSFTIDGNPIATTVTANTNGAWSFTPTGLADGPHTIVASQTDTFGNTGSASLSLTLDTSAPAVAITSPGGATNQASQSISGTVDVADAGATVTILDGITAVGSAVVQANGTWTATGVTLSNGSNSLTARVTDAAGNIGTSSAVIYTLSTTGPSVTEALSIDTGSSASDHITSNDAVSGTGLANTVVSFTIDGTAIATTVTANANGAWSFTPTGLADGPHTILASQTDTFGNTGSASLSFTLDTSAPVVAITSPGGATNQASQTISGTVDVADAGATVTILDGTTAVGSAIVQPNGSWTATGVTLSSGSNSLTARVTDAAGNTGTSNAVIYTLSTTGPSVTEALAIDTGSSASDHITSNDAVNGTGLANAVVSFTIDGTAIATTVTANANGAWSFTPTGLADGPHTIVASQTDTFGNAGSASLSFTLDTTAPVVAITSAGGATNQAAHTLSGTGEAGSVVTLFDNGSATALGTATVGSNGTWSAGVTLSGNGSHSIVARETDAAGNTGSSTAVVFNLSTTGPTVTEALSIDTGSSASDHITSNDAVSGTGLANTVVSFTIDGSAIASAVTANANGAWSFTPTGLADGPHTIVASQTDTFGNTGSASLSFTLDTSAPAVAITSPGGATNQASQTISGTVDVADAGATVTILDGITAVGSAVVQANGTWTATGVTLSNGSNSLTARVTDAAGNIGTSSAVIYTLSTTGPSVTEALSIDTGSSASDHVTSNDAVSGTGLANTVVSFTIDGTAIATTVTANANGVWSFTPTGLADGPHTIVASQTDTFGNTGSASLSFTLDTTAPVVAITSAGGATNQAAHTLAGTGEAGSIVTLFDNGSATALGTATVGTNGTWSAGVTLSGNGSHSIMARETDAAGNTGSSTAVVFNLSTTGPTVTEALSIDTGSSASDHITSNDAVSGTGLANTVVSFTIDGTAIAATVTANANGAWSFTPTGLADGPHTIVASQTDTFGNTGSASLSFTLDTSAPAVAITSAGGPTNQASQTISGTVDVADAGATVTILDGITAVGSAVVQANGTWTATGVTLSNGSNSLTARVTDAAGNTATSNAVIYTLSTTGPTVTEALAIDTGSSASDHITSNDAVGGTGLANTVVSFTIDGTAIATTVTANATGAWSFTPTGLADGPHTIVASQTDTFGNTGSASLSFTLDTTAPLVAITSAGGATNQASQTISGTVDVADAGATVTILDGTTAVGSAVVQANGTWTATGVTLSSGSNSLTARVTDAAGNTATSNAVIYTLSITGPTVTEALSIDTGSSAGDHITSNDAVSGTGLANTVVHFSIDGTAIATTVTANANGAWSFTPTGLADGPHTIVASQTDTFGNTGSASLSFTLDTTAPAVAITSLGGATNQAAHTLAGTGEAGSVVTLFDNGSATALGTATVGSNGTWSAGVTLSGNGSHSIVARETDAAGNTGSSTAVVFNLSTTGPTVTEALSIDTGSSASDHITSNDAVSGTGLANTVVSFTIDGNPIATTVTANANGVWSFTPTGLADGPHTIVASQTDTFGNTGSASLSFTLDTSAPVVAITSAGGPTNQASQTISGTVDVADAGATVTILDGTTAVGSAVVQANGSWTATGVTLSNGSNSLTARVTDAAGNTATSSAVIYTLTVIPNGWANPNGGNWNVAANWSSGAVPANTANVSVNPVGTAPYIVTITAGSTISANSLTLDDPFATLLDQGTLTIAASLLMTAGAVEIDNGGTLSVGGSPSLNVGFAGTGGNLILGNSPGFTGTITAVSSAVGPVSITGSGNVRTTSGDAIDLSASGGTQASPSNLSLGLLGTINGAAIGIDVVQNGVGNIAIATSGPVVGAAGQGILAQQSATGVGSILIDGSANVTSLAAGSSGIEADNLNAANGNSVTVNQVGNITGGYDGIRALTDGTGNVSVTVSPGTAQSPFIVDGINRYGIEAVSNSTGSISVTTGANDFILAGSAGIDAYNQATSIPQQGGITTSNISVTTAGVINSGFLLTGSSSRPAGILAGYRGGTTNAPNAAVFGNVTVTNAANIVALGGDGIRAYNYGSGNVTVQDLANTTIAATDEFGISASSYGIGRVLVTTAAGDIVNSGSTGIQAINLASAIAASAGSTVSLTARGTVITGTHLTPGGNQPQGLSAGYYPGNTGVSNTNVNGSVSIDNFANVSAAAGWGIDAYNYGNGSVTVTDETGTSVSGAQYGIGGYSNSTGTGSVTINVAANANVSAGSLYGLAAIQAGASNAGNISITTSIGDVINSGGNGIAANNQTTSAPTTSQISIQAAGTINSGYNNGQDGIFAAYTPGGVGAFNGSVAGNVVVDSTAAIHAAAGTGILLSNWGVGNLTATLESSSAITAVANGVVATASGGGNVSVTNKGTITVATGTGIYAQTGTGAPNSASGVISISNSGSIAALGSAAKPVIQVNNGSTQVATFTNTGTLTASLQAQTASSVAIGAGNGAIVINNSGTISGNVQLATATFNNNTGSSIWNVRGSNSFGSGANAINNSGTINTSGASSFSALAGAGNLAFNNTGTVVLATNSSATIGGAVSGGGTFSIGSRAQLEFGGSVAAGQTISFASGNGLLTVDTPATFNAAIAAFAVGDIINLLGATVSGTISGTTLTISEAGGPTLTTQVATGVKVNMLTGSEITLVPTSAVSLASSSTTVSQATSTSQFYLLAGNASVSAGSGAGLNISSSDATAGDMLAVEIDQGSTVSAPGAGVSLVATGNANAMLVNAGTITSSTGNAIVATTQTGSADVVDFGNVTGSQIGINVHTNGLGLLNILVGGGATITATTSYGVLAIATAGSTNVTTLGGTAIRAGSAGILAENQGTSVPLSNGSSITVSAQGTINAGTTPLGSGAAPSGIVAGYVGGASTPASPPNPNVFGNVIVQNQANINAAAGSGINAFNYGTGDVSVSDGGGAIITATQAGNTAGGSTQYGIAAFNYGSGDTTVSTDFGTTINSGGSGVNVGNQATAIAASAASKVSVVAYGTINSGANLDNSGSSPAAILAGFNPGGAGLFNANVAGDVLISDSGTITAAAGDGVRGYNYGVGDIEIFSYANITALVASASTGRSTPYGIGGFNYGPGDIVIATGSTSVIHSGGSGVDANNQATAIASSANSIIAITTAGSISSGTIVNPSGSQPGGIQVGYLGGTSGGAANPNVNGTVIVNNSANITAAAGWGIDAYNYGNGDVTVDEVGGTSVSGAQFGIAAYAESGGSGNVSINVGPNASITGTSNNGILAFSTDAGNISVITGSGDNITSGSSGINAVNEAAAISAVAASSITVTAYGTINSGTTLTGTSSPPGGIVAGYLGGATIPTVFPLTALNGDVVVNNFATINAAGGDGIRAYNFGIGDITVNDGAGSITLGGGDPVNGYDVGIAANNSGTGSIMVSTAAGILIDSRNGSSGIAAINKAPAPSPGSTVVVPTTSHISVLAYGTIESGTGLTGSGDPAAGILAGYDPNNTDVPNSNVQGSVWIDDYASITAPVGTDGIRGFNYGTGTVNIIAEVGAVITAGRYAIGAFSYNGGDVTVTNYATLTGGTAAIDATSTSSDPVVINNYGNITGVVLTANAAFDNETGAVWNLAGNSIFASGANTLINAGTINASGTSGITSGGSLSVTNTGTVNVLSGTFDIAADVSGSGTFTIANGAILEIGGAVGLGAIVTFLGATGTLTLDHSETSPFKGQISNLDASASSHDSIDLADMTFTAQSSAQYAASAPGSNSGVLTVSDGNGHTEAFNLINYTGAGVFTTQSDGAGGTLVFDPPAASAATGLTAPKVVSADAQVSPSGVDGQVTFKGASADDAGSASVTADHGGAGYLGSFWLDPVVSSNGQQAVGWHFASSTAQSDQIMPSQVLSQSYEVALLDGQGAKAATQEVTIMTGGAGADTFHFKPGMGEAVITNFSDLAADKIDLQQSTISNFVQLQAAIQPVHDGHDTLIELNHGDSLTLANVAVSQLHANNFIFA